MTATRRESAGLRRKAGRWALSLLVAALCALLLWFGLGWQRDDTDVADATAPAAGGDMVPPIDDGAEPSPPPTLPDHTTTDVIPPEEP
jgi:hypothetical protein